MRAAPSIVFASAVTLLLGCSDSTGPSQPPAIRSPRAPETVSFQVTPSTATIQHGQSIQLTTTFDGNPALSSGPVSVAWHSADEGVAAVSPTGSVRGVSGGRARIVATWGVYQASATITVTGPMKKHEEPTVCLKRLPRPERSLALPC